MSLTKLQPLYYEFAVKQILGGPKAGIRTPFPPLSEKLDA